MPLPFAPKALPFAVSLVSALLLAAPVNSARAEAMNGAQPCPHATPKTAKNSTPDASTSKPSPDGAIQLSADEARYEPNGQMYLHGDVTLQYGPYQARSDEAVLDQNSDTGSLTGLIRIESDDVYVEGRDATVNLETGAASVKAAAFNLKESGLRGQASEVNRPSETELTVRDGFFTTCQPGDNSWSFAVSEVNLDQESGFGTARHARFQVKDVPVLYVPWFTFPIDDRRKTGFLYPATGSSNTGHGMYLSTPYYFNIAPHMDATLTPSFINERGLHNALEFRHLSPWTHSTLAASYIQKDEYFVGEQRNEGKQTDGERWGLSVDQLIALESVVKGWSGQINYEAVSDNDYLDDLRLGLHVESDSVLSREFASTVVRDDWMLSFQVQAPRSLDDELLPEDLPYQRLPELGLRHISHWAGLSYEWDSRYSYFYRDQSDLVQDDKAIGSRFLHRFQVSLPLRERWGYVEPGVTLDQRDYLLQDFSGPPHLSSSVPFGELDSGLYFDRALAVAEQNYRLSLEPRAYYVYVPRKDQDELPDFDTGYAGFQFEQLFSSRRFTGGDRVADQSRMSLGLTHRWYSREFARELFRLSLAQVSWFKQTQTSLDDQLLPQEDRQYAADLFFPVREYLAFNSAYLWNENWSKTEESLHSASYHSTDYRYVLNLGYRYVADSAALEEGHEQSDTSFIAPLNEAFSVLGRWRFDLENNRTIGTLAGLEYRSCCWRMQLLGQSYLDEDSDISHAMLFRFQLVGLGGFGADKGSMDQIIPGYALREERAF